LERRNQLALENDMLHLRKQQSNTWKALWWEWGTMDSNFVAIPISRWKCFICQNTLMDRGVLVLLEKLFGLLQVNDVTTLRLTQQYECQENLPDKVFFRVEATTLALQEE